MPIVKIVEKLTHTDIPPNVYLRLNNDEGAAVSLFIELGGEGWECALEMQRQLWGTQRGRSIDNLRSVLKHANIHEPSLLGWRKKYKFEYGSTLCQSDSSTKMKKLTRWFTQWK